MREDWIEKELGDLCDTTSGGTPSRKNKAYFSGNIPWVKSGELDKGVIFNTKEKISAEAIENSSAKIFPKGTLLIALYGATIGKLAFLGVDASTNQAVCGIFENKIFNSKYLYYFLLHKRRQLVGQGVGGAQPNISQTILKKLSLPVAPFPEQLAIVTKIDELFSSLDSGIVSLKATQAQLKIYRQAVLKKAFDGELTKEWREVNKSIFSWTDCTFKGLTRSLKRGPFGGDLKKAFFVDYGYAVYEQQHAINDNFLSIRYFINDDKFKKLEACNVGPGDYIVSCSGTMGKIARLPHDAPIGIINQALMRIRLNEDVIRHDYFLEFFRSSLFQRKILKDSRGSGMQNMAGIKEIKPIAIKLPPLEEQKQIVQEIESRLSVCDNVEQSIEKSLEKSEALRQSILKKAFDGSLLSDLEIEQCKQEEGYEPVDVFLKRIQAEKIAEQKADKEAKTKRKN